MKTSEHPTEKLGRNPKTSKKRGFRSFVKSPKEILNYLRGLGRSTKLALALILVLIIVGGLVGLLGGNDANEESFATDYVEEIPEENTIKATLSTVEGTVEAKNQNGDWMRITSSHELNQGDDIRTVGATARAAIEFEGGSIVRIDANSEILLETLKTDRIVIKQINGYSYNRVVPSETASYIVKSTEAQYEAVGTAFHVITSGDEQAVEVFENMVIETATNQEVSQGKKLTVNNRIEPSRNGRIEPVNIEEVKQNSFITWNRSLDLENDTFKNSLGFLSDIESPKITISSPADNATILLEPNAEKGAVEFTGTTEPNSRLSILSKSVAGAEPINVTIDASGSFASPVIEAPLGSSVFEFTAIDRTGNKTVQNMRLTFLRKSAPITSGGIVLSIAKQGDNLKASWQYSGSFKPVDGVKIVYSKSSSPILGDNDFGDAKNGTSATLKLSELLDDTTYYFRACNYDKANGTCADYSNETTFKTPK